MAKPAFLFYFMTWCSAQFSPARPQNPVFIPVCWISAKLSSSRSHECSEDCNTLNIWLEVKGLIVPCVPCPSFSSSYWFITDWWKLSRLLPYEDGSYRVVRSVLMAYLCTYMTGAQMHLWVYGCICVHSCVTHTWLLCYIDFKRSVHVFPRLPGAGSGCRTSDARLSSNWDDARWSNLCVWVWERERVCLQLQSGYGAAEAHCAHLCVLFYFYLCESQCEFKTLSVRIFLESVDILASTQFFRQLSRS